ncbi:MAG: 3-dehydroquinate dehydratase [Acidimicrobiia bacterium]|nr:3-dehydroquinate dehydratase [Acidimicrobiia bacterium]
MALRGRKDDVPVEADAAGEPAPSLIRILHGPNLNLLGERDPEHYGSETLAEIEHLAMQRGEVLGLATEFFHTNHEGELVEAVQAAGRQAQGIIINPGALTHYSRALADAIDAVDIPVVEVHLSNIHARDEWRRTSVTAPCVTAIIAGFRQMGYVFAIDAMSGFLNEFAAA